MLIKLVGFAIVLGCLVAVVAWALIQASKINEKEDKNGKRD